jgi:hypothetical protein
VPERVSIQAVDAAHASAIWARTVIVVWRGTPSLDRVQALNRFGRRFVGEGPGAATCLYIVEPSSPPPGDVARRELAVFSREIASKMALAVIVAEGGGFRASLVRGVGIALTALMPHRVPFKFVHDVEEALALLAPHLLPTSGGAAALEAAAAEVRASIGAHAVELSAP